MIKFIGEYTAKMDDKGRIVFPSPFKALLPSDSPMQFVVKKDIFEDCLEMFTLEEWERQSEEINKSLNPFNRAHAAFWRRYTLLESIGVTREVVFSGNDYKIEIWAKEKFEASAISNEEFLNIAGLLSQER